uniref:RWD domain-containing protein n=1 Tax=Strigamia maritima TaxID=126957 RepID=T1J2I9_STRMM
MAEELQLEEIEVLKSIYEGDENFKEIVKTLPAFQYKISNKDELKTFLLEIVWEKEYPDTKPQINLDAFYNKHVSLKVKESIINKINEEADQYLGTAMTYTLIEWVKENADDLLADQPDDGESLVNQESTSSNCEAIEKLDLDDADKPGLVEKQKKLNLSKQQKKKMFDQLNTKGERPRGWDWVDVIKHLSQSGGIGADSAHLASIGLVPQFGSPDDRRYYFNKHVLTAP